MSTLYECPGCSGRTCAATVDFPESVHTLNYIYRTPQAARQAPKAAVRLRQCAACGLIHVDCAQPACAQYDDDYENTQECSPSFAEHIRDVCGLLVRQARIAECKVLEVGCGKGGFLKAVCAMDNWSGVGFDTSYDGPARVGRACFHREYVTPERLAGERFDMIVCRHVVEHVAPIGSFLEMLAECGRRAEARLIMIETPDYGWIADRIAFWDIYHEHRNYFSRQTLAALCERAGLCVETQVNTFHGQYQNVLLSLRPRPPGAGAPTLPLERSRASLDAFAQGVRDRISALAKAIEERRRGGGWAIWGAGAKGVCLANYLWQMAGIEPETVFDINPRKQGAFLPGCAVPIHAPGKESLLATSLIVVPNPAYAGEIRRLVAGAVDSPPALLVLD